MTLQFAGTHFLYTARLEKINFPYRRILGVGPGRQIDGAADFSLMWVRGTMSLRARGWSDIA